MLGLVSNTGDHADPTRILTINEGHTDKGVECNVIVSVPVSDDIHNVNSSMIFAQCQNHMGGLIRDKSSIGR